MRHSTDRIAHTTAFVTPVVEQWLEREIAQWVHPMKDRLLRDSLNERKNEHLMTPHHKDYKSAIGCQTKGVHIFNLLS